MKCWMGIDSGTSGIKAVIIDENGKVAGQGYTEQDVISNQPGFAEQDPEVWWKTCCSAVQKAVRASGLGTEIEAIGFSGQMQGAVLLDKEGIPIRNCIIWMDQRSFREVKEVRQILETNQIPSLEITGNHCLTSFWAPKLYWVKKNEPENYDRIDKILFPKDYLAYRATGEIVSDVSDAACSFLFDIRDRCWSERMLTALDIPRSFLPDRVIESSEIAGTLLPEVARNWGVREKIPVIIGGGDQTVNGVGTGVINPSVYGVSIGTSAVVFGCSDKPFYDRQDRAVLSLCHSVKEKWAFLGLSLTAGASMKWLRDVLFADRKTELQARGMDIYDYITGIAGQAPIGSGGLTFLPYFNGDSTPNNDPEARACYIGMSLQTGLPEICRSVMEGVTFSLRDSLEIYRQLGHQISRIHISGGGAKSPMWRQMMADIFHTPVITTKNEEAGATGAAILAAVGSGYYSSVEEGCKEMVRLGEIVEPVEGHIKMYDDSYLRYHEMYRHLRPVFGMIAEHSNAC